LASRSKRARRPPAETTSRYKPTPAAELSFTYNSSERARFAIGATDIYTVTLSAQYPAETGNGLQYEPVQFGLNGAAYCARLWHKF